MKKVDLYYDSGSNKLGVAFYTDDTTLPLVCFINQTNTHNDYQLKDDYMFLIGNITPKEKSIQDILKKLIDRFKSYDENAAQYLIKNYLDVLDGR